MPTIEQKIANPSKFYRHPRDVKADKELSIAHKITLLTNWRNEEELKSIATEENMLPADDGNNVSIASIETMLAEYQKKQ